MSKSFDTQSVGLPQLYAQLRTKSIPNVAGEVGATIRATTIPNPAPPPAPAQLPVAVIRNGGAEAVPVADTILVRAIIDNGGEKSLDSTPVQILVVTNNIETVTSCTPSAGGGRMISVLGNTTQGAAFQVLPGANGLLSVAILLTGPATPRVTVLAGQDMVSTDIAIT